jgi:tetratricopeptide (TPR) repeat protein
VVLLKEKNMKKKIVVSLIIYMLFAASPARAETAIDFYRLGLESSMFNKKIHYFTKAVELNPTLAVAYEKRGRLYYFQEKYGEMLRDFRRFTALRPSDPEGYRMIGLAQLKLGNLAEAIIKLSRAIEMDPLLASAYLNRAEAYYLNGFTEQAIEDSTKAIQLGKAQSTIGKAYTIRSRAYRQLGQEGLADENFNKAYLLDPEYYGYRYFTITNHLASFVSDSNYIPSKDISWLGLIGIVVLLFVLIFKLALPTPRKGG